MQPPPELETQSASIIQSEADLLVAVRGSVKGLQSWLQGCLFAGIQASDKRGHEQLQGLCEKTETVHLRPPTALHDDFKLRLFVCAAFANVVSEAKTGPHVVLKALLGKHIWNGVQKSKSTRVHGTVAACLEVSQLDDSSDAILDITIAFDEGQNALNEVWLLR